MSTYLLKEPVKEAVREALREEAAGVEPVESVDVDRSLADRESPDAAAGGRSIGSIAVVLVTVGGLAYLARRRMRSDEEESAPGEREDFERSSHGSTGEVDSSTATVSDEP